MPPIAASVKRPPAACIIFFADGLSQVVLKRMLIAGELPNIDRLFARGGVEVENAIVCLPSLTYANAVSLVTGLFPGHHGILGNQWFDPTTLEYRDYGGPLTYRRVNHDIRHATIYDLLDDHFTLNVQCHTRKGVKHTIDQDISSGILWGLGRYQTVDRRVGDVLPRVARVINREGRWPIVWMNYFPGVDEIGHRFGPDSPEYAAAVRNVDAQVARIAAFAQENAAVERLFLTFVTDHGMIATPRERRWDYSWSAVGGNVILRRPSKPPCRAGDSSRAFALLGTDRALRVHVRGPRGWGEPLRDDRLFEIAKGTMDGQSRQRPLAELPCISWVCRPVAPVRVAVESAGSRFDVERRQDLGQSSYRVIPMQGSPPDRIGVSVCGSEWRSSREWLNATSSARFPDFVPQICDLFDSPRTGNVVCFAAADWSFHPRFVAGHGSCLAADMRVSHFYAGPGLPAGGKVQAARLVDVMPTLLDLLGHHDRLARVPPIDGVSIRLELEAAAQPLTLTP